MSLKESTSGQEGPFIDNHGYIGLVLESYNYFRFHFISGIDWKGDLATVGSNFRFTDLLVILMATLIVRQARQWLSEHVFKPICHFRAIPDVQVGKACESGFKLVFHLCCWSLIADYVFRADGLKDLTNPKTMWEEYSIDRHQEVPSRIYWIYAIEFGHYFYSLYTTLAVDIRRKDTPAMLLHHGLCLGLLTLSYLARTHRGGMIILFLHDFSDIFLEITKLLMSFKDRKSNLEKYITGSFLVFLASWVTLRLYLLPVWHLYYAIAYHAYFRVHVPFLVVNNLMICLIFLLNVYWFTFAARVLLNTLTGKSVEDNREYNEESPKPEVTPNQRKRRNSGDSGVVDHSSDSSDDHFRSKNKPEDKPEVKNILERNSDRIQDRRRHRK